MPKHSCKLGAVQNKIMKTLASVSAFRSAVLGSAAPLLALMVAGCAAPVALPPTGGPPVAPPPGTSAAPITPPGSRPLPPPVSPLVSEQHWLEEWFRGTPVLISLADVNTLAVDVPLANSFDTGKTVVKPALAAVLDRIATSLRRQPGMRMSIAAPPDAAANNMTLASARAQQVRNHLVAHGVPATRMSGVGTARAGAAVQLRLLTTPLPIGRLDDASLPAPAAGVRPPAPSTGGIKPVATSASGAKPALAAPASGAAR